MTQPLPWWYLQELKQRDFERSQKEVRDRGTECQLGDLPEPRRSEVLSDLFSMMSAFGGGITWRIFKK